MVISGAQLLLHRKCLKWSKVSDLSQYFISIMRFGMYIFFLLERSHQVMKGYICRDGYFLNPENISHNWKLGVMYIEKNN